MKTTELIRRIKELINDDGYTSYSKLPDYLQHELTALHMHILGKYAHEMLGECDDIKGCIADLISHLINGTIESAIRLANTMRDNARLYYADILSELYDCYYAEFESENNREAGAHPIIDPVNGETRWVR